MSIKKIRTIRVSELIFNKVLDIIDDKELELEGHLEVFNNCREQGFVLSISNADFSKSMHIWAYGQRNSDCPTITWDYEQFMKPAGQWNMYSEESYRNMTEYFKDDEEIEAALFVVKIIEGYFNEGTTWVGSTSIRGE